MKTTLEKAKLQSQKDTVKALQTIIGKNYDARMGYRKAMMTAKNPALRYFLQQQARQRSHFTTAIDKKIRKLGETPREKGSLAGAFHRKWIEVKGSMTNKKDNIILEEIIRGKKVKLNKYRGVMKKNTFTPEINALLEWQVKDLKTSLNQIKNGEGII